MPHHVVIRRDMTSLEQISQLVLYLTAFFPRLDLPIRRRCTDKFQGNRISEFLLTDIIDQVSVIVFSFFPVSYLSISQFLVLYCANLPNLMVQMKGNGIRNTMKSIVSAVAHSRCLFLYVHLTKRPAEDTLHLSKGRVEASFL